VEEHVECTCGCDVTAGDCNARQLFLPAECRCGCPNIQERKDQAVFVTYLLSIRSPCASKYREYSYNTINTVAVKAASGVATKFNDTNNIRAAFEKILSGFILN
jgi:hypothetical protein